MSARGGDRALLERLFRSGVEASGAAAAVRRGVQREGADLVIAGERIPVDARLVVLAAGKAAAEMAAALEAVAGDRIACGLAVTKEGHGAPLRRVALREAGHPVPDARGERAARELLELAASSTRDECIVLALSGGASALLACPAAGLSLADLAATTRALLASGADIDEVNTVRRHLSALAGGRLAQRAGPARIYALCISDVPGDRLDVIGSGPCAADPTRFADALDVLDRHGLRARVPEAVRAHLEAGARGERPETPKPGDPALDRVRSRILCGNRDALLGAARAAGREGVAAVVLPGVLRGEARVRGRQFGALAGALRAPGPVCVVAGGETTVTVRGDGRGGRSQELALAAAVALAGLRGATLLAAGTDGTDGPTDAAGAFADGDTLSRAASRGLDPRAALARNDAYGFFAAEGGLLRTGPTRTNVMDLVLLLMRPAGAAARLADARARAHAGTPARGAGPDTDLRECAAFAPRLNPL